MLHHDINNVAGRLGSFARGRVALIGDSAHAMTPDPGQGGCLATAGADREADGHRRTCATPRGKHLGLNPLPLGAEGNRDGCEGERNGARIS